MQDYFNENEEEAFRWNEFEHISLESTEEEEKQKIINFWNNHLPFLLSVIGDYAYVGIVLKDKNK